MKKVHIVIQSLIFSGLFIFLVSAVQAGPVTRNASDEDVVKKLSAVSWRWSSFVSPDKSVTVEKPESYELTFGKDGTLQIVADCNRAVAKYVLEGKSLSITVGPMTLAACAGESRSEQFVGLLGKAKQFSISGNFFVIALTDGTALAFSGPTVADICGEKALRPNTIEDTLDPGISANLDKRLVSFITAPAGPSPGASMLIITPKGRYFKAAGVSSLSSCALLGADSPYQIGSNTKMMTSAIIYQLQEEGRLTTSDLLSKWLPNEAAKLPDGDKITLEMMLTHTTGLPDYFEVETGAGKISSGISDEKWLKRGFTPSEIVDLVAKYGKQDFKPGEAGKWRYSNTGFILLGMIIEKVTGKSYEKNLKNRILKPLKMKKTYLQKGGPKAGALPEAYYEPPFTFRTDGWDASQGWAAGAVVSNPEEFAVFLKALFTGKLFKKASTLKLMSTILDAGKNALGEGISYGHGMTNNRGILGHGGETLGFQSDGGYIPEKDVTIVIWGNSGTNGTNRLVVPVILAIATAEVK